jgi:hypothetical protein
VNNNLLDRGIESLFLRAYAKNLGRRYRNDAANAASDAQIQTSTMILIGGFAVFIIVGSLCFPAFLGRFLKGGDLMYGSMIGVGLVVVFGINWRFKGYEKTPELARRYATLKSRRGSLVWYWAVMLGFVLTIFIFLRQSHG